MQKMREVFLSATVSSESQQRTASPRKGARTERSPDPIILDNLINKWGKLKSLIAALNRGPTKVAVKSPKTSPRQTRLEGLPLDA